MDRMQFDENNFNNYSSPIVKYLPTTGIIILAINSSGIYILFFEKCVQDYNIYAHVNVYTRKGNNNVHQYRVL